MSEGSLQMLLHASEVEYIVKTIRAPKLRNAKFVGGCLFGLWRNSLKQPTIQFVTGPGKAFNEDTTVKKMFDNKYTRDCVNYIRNSHQLLHLGFWFFGTKQHKEEAETLLFMGQKKYNVLLFIDLSNVNDTLTLTGEYILQKDNSKVKSQLYKEDVLPGDSSFRLYEPLTREIKEGAIKLQGDSFTGLLNELPSRVQVEEAVTHDEQWYSTDQGMEHLQLMMQYFNVAGIQAGMSRDAVTHNIQFDLGGGYSLDFPCNFPKGMPLLRSPDGQQFKCPQKSIDGRDVCKFVVDLVSAKIQSLQEQSGRWGRRGWKGR